MTKRVEELDKNLAAPGGANTPSLRWIPATDKRFTMRGLWWNEENAGAYCRLPLRAEAIVRPEVWQLAQQTAGARVCFRSNTTSLRVRATLLNPSGMPHMPATGQSGLALYAGPPLQQRPWPVAFPAQAEDHFEASLFADKSAEMREFTLYLPLYNGLKSLDLALSPGARVLRPSPAAEAKPVVFYGTSITQGGCAHNPGADYPSILGRMLSLDTINLGFSGNGRGEPALARLISEIDASLVVLDYVANARAEGVRKTLPRFCRILREGRPELPIALVSRVMFSQCIHDKTERQEQEAQRDVILNFYARQRHKGDTNLHFIDGNVLIPFGKELAYSDSGVHPTNVGFELMAKRLAPQIEYILANSTSAICGGRHPACRGGTKDGCNPFS
ncbi:MAG: SGNH/GDSL hydrolase family protein [Planctomycetes bacterium]|nr:SGNH/GDSL hydrolase family protein [Planctomycetota bacterium]